MLSQEKHPDNPWDKRVVLSGNLNRGIVHYPCLFPVLLPGKIPLFVKISGKLKKSGTYFLMTFFPR